MVVAPVALDALACDPPFVVIVPLDVIDVVELEAQVAVCGRFETPAWSWQMALANWMVSERRSVPCLCPESEAAPYYSDLPCRTSSIHSTQGGPAMEY